MSTSPVTAGCACPQPPATETPPAAETALGADGRLAAGAAPGARKASRAAGAPTSAKAGAPRPTPLRPAAAKPANPAKPPPGTQAKPPAGYATSKAAGDWSFLDDKGLSIEDKLALFAAKAMERVDKDLEAKLAKYKADFVDAKPAQASGSSKKGGFKLWDAIKVALPVAAVAEKVIGEAGLKKAAGALGGPVLAALATGLGMPALAPLALKYGGEIAQMAFTEVGATSDGPASSGAPAKKEAGSPDEKVAMLELQMLVEKQQRMFTAISSTLKVLHDTQMAAVHNLR